MKRTEIEKAIERLDRFPQYRDNKYKYISHRLWEEIPAKLKTPEVLEVLQMVTQANKGKLPALETLSRAWRKALELNPAWITAKHQRERQEQQVETVNILYNG